MILQHLCDFYDRMAADPRLEIAGERFAMQKISFEVVIGSKGTLSAINDIRDREGVRLIPRLMSLPYQARTSGIKPMFLWDKSEYLLGHVCKELRQISMTESESDRLKREKKAARVRECFDASRRFHQDFAATINDRAFQSLCDFLSNWSPENISVQDQRTLDEIGNGFGVFRMQGESRYLHEVPEIKQVWKSIGAEPAEDAAKGSCLVTGKKTEIARIHPTIKGVRGAQSSGASVVSCNHSAFASYGKTQSYNSPIGEDCAYRYSTALNRLLQENSGHKLHVADCTCIFWADVPGSVEETIFAYAMDPNLLEDDSRSSKIHDLLQKAMAGERFLPDPDMGFHVLGLSPNASRLAVRFYISETAGAVLQRLIDHQMRMKIARGPKDPDWIPLWMLLLQTARELKDVPPSLAGAILRSVLMGDRYPESLLAVMTRRIRVEQGFLQVKAAIIKAILNHNYDKRISVMLDIERPEGSYQLGRLLACLERTEQEALPGLVATIKDRFFATAASTPAVVFPRLIQMNSQYMIRLDKGMKVMAERRIQEVIGRVGSFPNHLDLIEQGLFSLGYYHQRQDFFTSKEVHQST
jgi:CRISPR-associated protein Csd1